VTSSRTSRIAGVYTAGRLVKKPIALLLVPVIHADVVRYVLGVVMDPATLSKVFVEQPMPVSWTSAIIDDRLSLAGRSLEGELVYTVFSRSSTTGWTVALGIPAGEVEGPIHATPVKMAAADGLLVLLALLVTGAVGRKIVQRRQASEQALQDELAVRQQVEPELRASQQRLRDVSTSSAEWFWKSDADQRFTVLSDNFDVVIGRPSKQLLGLTRVELLTANGLNPIEIGERPCRAVAAAPGVS
jgi:PAS domain-containing protein